MRSIEMEVCETCGCGASITVKAVYPSNVAQECKEWRKSHRCREAVAGSPSVDKEKLEAIRSAANTVLAAFGPVKPSGKLGETLIRLEEAVRD